MSERLPDGVLMDLCEKAADDCRQRILQTAALADHGADKVCIALFATTANMGMLMGFIAASEGAPPTATADDYLDAVLDLIREKMKETRDAKQAHA